MVREGGTVPSAGEGGRALHSDCPGLQFTLAERPLPARHCACLAHSSLRYAPDVGVCGYHPYSADEETEAHRGHEICPGSDFSVGDGIPIPALPLVLIHPNLPSIGPQERK